MSIMCYPGRRLIAFICFLGIVLLFFAPPSSFILLFNEVPYLLGGYDAIISIEIFVLENLKKWECS